MIPNRVKLNGFTTPFNCSQLLSWIYIIFVIAHYYTLLFPFRIPTGIYYFSIGFDISTFLVCLLGLICTKIDPTDNLVKLHWKSLDSLPQADLDETNYKCNLCNAPIYLNSRHCSDCNRCTQGFDHHCKWINNCIGSKNYKYFIGLILFFEINQMIFLISCVYFLYICFDSTANIEKASIQVYHSDIFKGLIAMNICCSISSFVVIVLNGYLIIFHVYLKSKGMSTYQYILHKQAMEMVKTHEQLRITPKPISFE